MLTPEQLAQIADHATVRKLYDQLQEDIIADMARRLSKMDFAGYTTYRSLFLCFGLHRSRVGKYQKQTWKKSGLYKYTHG